MDEEQGLSSPIAGGIRAVRNTVSSSIFTGRSVLPQRSQPVSMISAPPPAPKPDPQTTSLLTQNSLQLTSVSEQLQNISVNLSSLNFSLSTIKDNLAVSDALARQREAAKQNRERILAEQGLREGKESEIEKRIQFALQTPVRRIARTTQGVLQRLVNFFLILAGGWLTNTVIDMISANADGNIELLNKLKGKLTTGLIVIGATLTAATIGLRKVFGLTALLASRAFRFGFNNILRRPFNSVLTFLRGRVGAVLGIGAVAGGIGGGAGPLAILSAPFVFLGNQIKRLGAFLTGKKPPAGAAGSGASGAAGAAATGGKIFRPAFRAIFGNIRNFFAFSTLFDIFINGVNPIEAIKNNLGGILTTIALAPLVLGFVKMLGLAGLAATILKFILGSVTFGLGKNLLSKFRLGGGTVQNQEQVEIKPIDETTETVSFGMMEGNNIQPTSTDNTLVAQTIESNSDAIVPINNKRELNVAENISNIEEGAPSIISIPAEGGGEQQPPQLAANGQVEDPSSKIPFIGFDNDNIYTSYAVTTFGAFA